MKKEEDKSKSNDFVLYEKRVNIHKEDEHGKLSGG